MMSRSNPPLEFRSMDRAFGLSLGSPIYKKILADSKAHRPFETGGVLIGRYVAENETALVTSVVTPPDSRRGRAWFERGTRDLGSSLRALWARPADRRDYYLGEWHSHPGGAALPSPTDLQQMQSIAQTESYQCPEPILLILGGDEGRWVAAAYVFPRNLPWVRLIPIQSVCNGPESPS